MRQYSTPDWCMLSVDPAEVSTFVYRSFLVTSDGILMVFNSYGEGNDSLFTGAREFYFFPRTSVPDGKVSGNILSVKAANPKAIFYFDTRTDKLVKMANGEIVEDPQVNANNNGGVEIKSFKGLMLDVGFALGHDPAMDRNRNVSFRDEAGQVCTLKATDVFRYPSGDVKFAFPTDAGLKIYLAKKCPHLKISF